MPVDLKASIYTDIGVENDKKDPKFEVEYHVRISKYKNIFVKSDTSSWFEEIFVIKKVKKSLFCRHMLLVILTMNKFLEHFMKNNCMRQIKESLELKK